MSITVEGGFEMADEVNTDRYRYCYYGDKAVCRGKTWNCIECGETYCEAHGHDTVAGINIECVACERERLELAEA